MFDTTPAAARALEAAQHWARLDDAREVLPAHLFQGLLLLEEGRPWLLLTDAGLDPHQVRRRDNPVADPDAFALELALHGSTREALARARELARVLGAEPSVATEHLLMALLEVDV